jgi:hypothetical protein
MIVSLDSMAGAIIEPIRFMPLFLQAWGYIDTYGAFFVHCGANSMGICAPEDDHCLHGELPNARYDAAEIVLGECEEKGAYVGLQGTYEHIVAFSANWVARPSIKLYEDSSTVSRHQRSSRFDSAAPLQGANFTL